MRRSESGMLAMNGQRRRVVVTGMDALSCLGDSLDEISKSLRTGRSGIIYSKEREALGFRSPLTGAIKPVDPPAHFADAECGCGNQTFKLAIDEDAGAQYAIGRRHGALYCHADRYRVT